MKAGLFIAGLFFLVVHGLAAQDLALEEILNRYYRSAGLDKLSKVNTVIMTGTLVQQDLMPVKIIRVRPDKYLMEYDVADLTAYQAFDGKTAWFTAPWTGNPAPLVATAERAADLANRADLEGVLFNWKEKGHELALAGRDSANGLTVYRIKVTRNDGSTEYEFIDDAGFMLQKRLSYRIAGGKEIEVENYYRDYRNVDGIPFAFTIGTSYAGRENEIQLESVLLDAPVDLNVFTMPETK